MTLRESLQRDIALAREHLLNSHTRDEANQRGEWLAKCKQRLADYDAGPTERLHP